MSWCEAATMYEAGVVLGVYVTLLLQGLLDRLVEGQGCLQGWSIQILHHYPLSHMGIHEACRSGSAWLSQMRWPHQDISCQQQANSSTGRGAHS